MSHNSYESSDRAAWLDPLLRISLALVKGFGIVWVGSSFLCVVPGGTVLAGRDGDYCSCWPSFLPRWFTVLCTWVSPCMTVCLLTAGDTEEFSVWGAVILYNLTLKTHQPVLTQHSCISWLEEEVGGCWWESGKVVIQRCG